MKLKTKLPLLLTLFLCIPLILLGAVTFIELKSAAEQRSLTQLTKFLEQVTAQADRLVQTAQANVELITNDPLLINYILTDDEDERYTLMQRPLQRKLKSIMRVFPQYHEVRVLLPDGYEDLRLTSPFIPNQTEEEGNSELFLSMVQSKNAIHTQFITNPDNDKFSLYVSKRLEFINKATDSYNAQSQVHGYLITTVDLTLLHDTLSNTPWSEGLFQITDQSGNIVLPATDKTKKNINPQQSELITNTNSFELVSIDDQHYYHTSVPLQETLTLHAMLPENILLQSSREVSTLVAIVTLLSIAVSIPLMLVLSHFQIMRPLNNLHRAIINLGNSHELVQVKTPGNDEINELGQKFNQMSLKLFKSNEKIRELAFNDSLTGLPNRFMFTKNLSRSIEIAKSENSQLAVMFIDLDNFKNINDSLGHHAGDQLLQVVALRLNQNLRGKDFINYINDRDIVARLGGDEFTVLLTDLRSVTVAEQIAKRIIDVISLPINLDGQDYYVGASIGIACYPDNGITCQELIKNADIAMYHAKKIGKGGYQNFTNILSKLHQEHSIIEQKLHKAIEDEAFELYFQPIINSKDHHITSLEALIRWYDPELGFIPPDQFIPLAEKNGLIMAIGDWVIRDACRQLKVWQDLEITQIQLAINVSALQLNNPNFADELSLQILNSGIIPSSLYIELTETTIISGEQEVIANLNRLREKNIKVALDDFGTGYSSLSYLRNLPIDILKIDRSFIKDLNNRNTNVILSAIITMAHALGYQVVAEGVEDQEHLAFLTKEGCDMLQGYLFSPPKTAREITQLLLDEQANCNPPFHNPSSNENSSSVVS